MFFMRLKVGWLFFVLAVSFVGPFSYGNTHRLSTWGRYDDYATSIVIDQKVYDTLAANKFIMNLDYVSTGKHWGGGVEGLFDIFNSRKITYREASPFNGAYRTISEFGLKAPSFKVLYQFGGGEGAMSLDLLQLKVTPSMVQTRTAENSVYIKPGHQLEALLCLKSNWLEQVWKMKAQYLYRMSDGIYDSTTSLEISKMTAQKKLSVLMEWSPLRWQRNQQLTLEGGGVVFADTSSGYSGIGNPDLLAGYFQIIYGLKNEWQVSPNLNLWVMYENHYIPNRYFESGAFKMTISQSNVHSAILGLNYSWENENKH
jgi:hypothetical protein